MQYSQLLSNDGFIGLMQRTLNHVHPQVVNHGVRVALMVEQMLLAIGTYSDKERRDLCLTALLHDIGAYKLDEIDKMLMFEGSDSTWDHSIYGYLFFKYFSFLTPYADAVLYHHTRWDRLRDMQDVSETNRLAAQLIHIADRADIFRLGGGSPVQLLNTLRSVSGTQLNPDVIDLFKRAVPPSHFTLDEEQLQQFYHRLTLVPFTDDLLEAGLWMLVFSIDFRSAHTVTHTITTVSISQELATRFGFTGDSMMKIQCGAMVHDLGKIAIPVNILESPGKLDTHEMTVMRTHVDYTREILADALIPEVREIALRHHEKLDGTGYPCGLSESDLTLPERIVAVGDIVSALQGTRSYKEPFPKEKILNILHEMAEGGKLDASVVAVMIRDFEEIMQNVNQRCAPLLSSYESIQAQYYQLAQKTKHPAMASV